MWTRETNSETGSGAEGFVSVPSALALFQDVYNTTVNLLDRQSVMSIRPYRERNTDMETLEEECLEILDDIRNECISEQDVPIVVDDQKCRHDWGYPSSGSCCSVYGYCCSQ